MTEKIKNYSDKVLSELNVYDDDSFLYLNYPFCVNKCKFCSYRIHDYQVRASETYLKYINYEIDLIAQNINNFKFKNVHIGGGTPNLVSPDLLIKPLEKLVDFKNIDRFIVEIAPQSKEIMKKYIESLKKYDVTKIQLGVQTLNEKILKKERRCATKKMILDTFEVLNASKIIWSIDLMYGLSGDLDGERDFISELEEILEYKPFGAHIYYLRSEKENNFYNNNGPTISNYYGIFDEKIHFALENIFQKNHYKFIADEWCRGDNLKHALRTFCYNDKNKLLSEFLGIGLGSITMNSTNEYQNTKNLDDYIRQLDENKIPIFSFIDFKKNNFKAVMEFYFRIKSSQNLNIDNAARFFTKIEMKELFSLILWLKKRGVVFSIQNGIYYLQSPRNECVALMERFLEKKK